MLIELNSLCISHLLFSFLWTCDITIVTTSPQYGIAATIEMKFWYIWAPLKTCVRWTTVIQWTNPFYYMMKYFHTGLLQVYNWTFLISSAYFLNHIISTKPLRMFIKIFLIYQISCSAIITSFSSQTFHSKYPLFYTSYYCKFFDQNRVRRHSGKSF